MDFAALAALIFQAIEAGVAIFDRLKVFEEIRTNMAREGRTKLTAAELALVDDVIAKGRALEAKLKGTALPPG